MQTFESPRATQGAEASRPTTNPLHVVCFSTYVSETTQQTSRHHDVRNFLLALRGEQIQGESTIPVGGEERALTQLNVNDSIDWFGEMVTRYLETCHIQPPFSLVPVPTSEDHSRVQCGSVDLASGDLDRVERARSGPPSVDVLRWKQPLQPPSQRGQTVSELYENLAMLEPLPEGSPVILVDYLFTGSSTLRACAARLRSHGARGTLVLVRRQDSHQSGTRSVHRRHRRAASV